MRSIKGAESFEKFYHTLYHELGTETQTPGPEPIIKRNSPVSIQGSDSFLRNLSNGVLENCIGWYAENLVAQIFGGTKTKELGRGSTLDLRILGNPDFQIEVKCCRWSNQYTYTQPNGRSYPVGRSMYYMKHGQLIEGNSCNQESPVFFAFVDYDFYEREELPFKFVKEGIRKDFKKAKIKD